jgi:hypothetical protein
VNPDGSGISATTATAKYHRESNGFLAYMGTTEETPTAKAGLSYCPFGLGADSINHLVFEYLTWDEASKEFVGAGYPLASFTVDSYGNLSTMNSYQNMPKTSVYPWYLSASPSGKLLAIGGPNSYQFFHFNGADPLVKLTGAYKSGNNVVGLAWDKSDHCYVLTTTSLILWKVTPTSYKQLAVYTYPTPTAATLIVRSLQ